jgi:Sulfotransferase family
MAGTIGVQIMSARIDTGQLLAAASDSTGLDYSDRTFVEPLEHLVESVNSEGDLSDAGVEGFKQDVVRLLGNRLRIEATIAADPAILDEDVSDPIVITGMPRTGTTKLQRILAGSQYQSLPLWKVMFPVPIALVDGGEDPRITITEELTEQTFAAFPDLMAGHPMRTHEPDEDVFVQLMSFRVPMFGWFFRAPSYVKWLADQDQMPAYEDLRRVLQCVQRQDGGRRGRPWALKAPAHLGRIDLLLRAFPGATVVHCHRDVHETVPSTCRLIELLRISRGAEHVDPHELAVFLTQFIANEWANNITQRAGLDPTQIVDVRYEDIRDDIGAVLTAIHDNRKAPIESQTLADVRSWEDRNPQHRFGKHIYSKDHYGLTDASIDEHFADYLRRFPPV